MLIRGLTATLAHQELLRSNKTIWVITSVVLGVYFLILQAIEYYTSNYSIASGAYGRIFFFGTGFHGLHVCLGVIILITRRIRITNLLVTSQHHFSVEFSL